MTLYPSEQWVRVPPEEVGCDSDKLGAAKRWLEDHSGDRGYRLAVVREGSLIYAVGAGIEPEVRLRIASAAKSIYSNVLGIAVEEGYISSPDAAAVGVYPEMMNVPEGTGPKEGRYAFEKDRGLTYRQLISNTSGYMKPGEEPGKVFHYQTYGMNVLTHAVAKSYGLYDIGDPEGSPGFAALIREKIADPIGVNWSYSLSNFELHKNARLSIFGYYCQVHANPLDLARVGWLWCNWGNWAGAQVIPEPWFRESVRVNPDLLENAPREQWRYGHGFWTNEYGLLWPDLPRDGFTASGAGGHYVTVFPGLRLVVVQNPGPDVSGPDACSANGDLLSIVLDAIR